MLWLIEGRRKFHIMSLRFTGKFSNNRCHIIKFMKRFVTAFALPKNDTLAILSCGLLFISYQLPLATFYVNSRRKL